MDDFGTNIILKVIAGALVTIVGGAVVVLKFCNQHNSDKHHDVISSKANNYSSTEIQVRFAARITAKQLREIGRSPDIAENLFAKASMRWAGPDTEWRDNARKMELSSLSICPSVDTDHVILTYTSSLPVSKIPTNRLAMRSCLKQISADGKLVSSDLYDCPQTLNPTRFGFQEG